MNNSPKSVSRPDNAISQKLRLFHHLDYKIEKQEHRKAGIFDQDGHRIKRVQLNDRLFKNLKRFKDECTPESQSLSIA